MASVRTTICTTDRIMARLKDHVERVNAKKMTPGQYRPNTAINEAIVKFLDAEEKKSRRKKPKSTEAQA